MIFNLDKSKTTEFILDHYEELGASIKRATRTYQGWPEELKVFDDGYGKWFCFGGYLYQYALIRAQSFDDAFDIYCEEFIGPPEEPENEEEADLGYYTNSGKWLSEPTISYIVSLGLDNIELEVSL